VTKEVKIGNLSIGNGKPIAIQSMTNTDTKDAESTVRQIEKLKAAGCQIVRISVYDEECVEAIPKIKSMIQIPLIADIHFDYKLAIGSILAGIDKVRINPGNIGAKWKVEEVARVARDHKVPIRVGANMGSIEGKYLKNFKERTDALVSSAMDEVELLESVGFFDIVVAVKSSDAVETIVANEKLSGMTDHPLHIGVTEAGVYEDAIVKSAFALGHLIYEGIGDTMRISIAGDPVREVRAGYSILQSVKAFDGPEIIACPTCARTEIDVEALANEVKDAVYNLKGKIKIAVMGCIVNGLGEAQGADIAVFGTKTGGVIYVDGKMSATVKRDEISVKLRELIDERLKGEK